MKRISAFIMAAIMVLSLSACNKQDFDPDEYVGEALISAFGALVDSNQYFYNEVFVLGRLAVDKKAAFEKDGVKYAPVVSEKYKSYEDFLADLKATYTDEAAAKILENYPYYADVDGKLCLDMSKTKIISSELKWERNTDKEQVLKGKTGSDYEYEYFFVSGNKTQKEDFDFIFVGNGVRNTYRLNKLQPIQ